MNTEVTFKSERFRPVLPDESQVNPGRYGAELAFWLCAELAKAGVVTSYPNYEDWGWFIEYTTESGDEYWLCCGNLDESDHEWMCFLEPKGKGIFGGKKAPLENAAPLLRALAQVLESEISISDIQWSAKT
ncbi:hypothetical protein L0337_32025 [candidate division KSB1 bacterium]|nr:hypothetical protein [candidate division KSB1 bacterium]